MPAVPEGKLGILMVDRETEYAPLKTNDSKSKVDTPAAAKKQILAEARTWLQGVQGLKIEAQAVGNVEVSPLLSYGGENLNWLKHIYKRAALSAPGGYLDHAGAYHDIE